MDASSSYKFLGLSLAYIYWHKKLKNVSSVSILHKRTSSLHDKLRLCNSFYRFRPSILYGFDWHGHLNTIIPTLIRKFFALNLPYTRELVTLPDEGTVGK